MEITQPIQDYIKTIYELTTDGRPASTTALAERLGIQPASVTGMLQRLAAQQPPLVTYRKRQGVLLTPQGRLAALEVIRHHRLLETFLVEVLGFTWDEVHEEACRLEHVISEKMEARIAAALGDPLFDPHGAPIPREDLSLPQRTLLPLHQVQAGREAAVAHVPDEDPALLRYLAEIGLRPGVSLRVEEQSPLNATTSIRLDGHPAIVLGHPVSRKIHVEVLP